MNPIHIPTNIRLSGNYPTLHDTTTNRTIHRNPEIPLGISTFSAAGPSTYHSNGTIYNPMQPRWAKVIQEHAQEVTRRKNSEKSSDDDTSRNTNTKKPSSTTKQRKT